MAMNEITIDTTGAGAVVDGTTRGDTASEWFAAHRPWRWAPSLRRWVLPRNLRPETVRERVADAAAALAALGVTVTVDGDQETEAERAERLDQRDRDLVDRHAARAERLAGQAAAAHQASEDAVAGIPFGQPVLVGHHSQRRHERAIRRSRAKLGQAVELGRESRAAAGRSASAAGRVAAREARAAGPRFGPADVAKGDHVLVRGMWLVVLRVNAQTVSVPNPVFDLDPLDSASVDKPFKRTTVAWAKVDDVRRPVA